MAEESKKPNEATPEEKPSKPSKPSKKEEPVKASPKPDPVAEEKEECAICATKESLKAVMTAFSLPAEAIARALTEATEAMIEASKEQPSPSAYILAQITEANASPRSRAVKPAGSAAITAALAYIEVVDKAAIAHQNVGECDCDDD